METEPQCLANIVQKYYDIDFRQQKTQLKMKYFPSFSV